MGWYCVFCESPAVKVNTPAGSICRKHLKLFKQRAKYRKTGNLGPFLKKWPHKKLPWIKGDLVLVGEGVEKNIYRILPTSYVLKEPKNGTPKSFSTVNDFLDSCKENFKNKKEKIGNYIPYTQFIIGPNERGQESLYILQEDIKGQTLYDLSAFKRAFNKNLKEQINALLKHAGPYENDFIWDGNRLWFVDV